MNDLASAIESMKSVLADLEIEAAQSDSGNLSAGGRARKKLQQLKKMAQEAKVFCLERDKTRKAAK